MITKKPYNYSKNDAVIINRLSESYLRTSVCSELGISNIFFDDILLDVIKVKSENFVDVSDKHYREGFLKVIETKNVPNITQLYLENKISLEDILTLKNSSGYEVFREWLKGEILLDSEKDFSEITGDLINEVERKSIGLSNNKLIKGIRLAISILIGVKFSPAIGVAHSVIDSLLIDYFFQQKSPKLFLDDYTKIAK